MKANGKGFIFNNTNNITYNNNNKKETIDNIGEYKKVKKNFGLINYYNNNFKNKTLETKLNMIGVDTKSKNGDFVNFQSEYGKQKFIINQSKNESEITTPKFIDFQRANRNTSSFRNYSQQNNTDNN